MSHLISDIDMSMESGTLMTEGNDELADLIDFSNLPSDYVKLDITLNLPKLDLKLTNEFDQRLVKLKIRNLQINVKQAGKFMKSHLTLEHFLAEDYWAKTKQWPNLMGTTHNDQIESAMDEKMAVDIRFETNQDFKKCPFHLDFRINHPLQVVANLPLILEVTRTMNKAL